MNDYVGAFYHEDKKVYVGKVLETDETDVHVSFLGHEESLSTSSSFKIPKNPDEVWAQKDHILCIIPEPTGGQKGKRTRLMLHRSTLERLCNCTRTG